MKNFFSAVFLCVFLLLVGMAMFLPDGLLPRVAAQSDLIVELLNLPAPPPPNPMVDNSILERSPQFYSQLKPPPDDAPIRDLIDYWTYQAGRFNPRHNYTVKPSERTVDRLLDEIDAEPALLESLINVLRDNPKAAEAVKRIYTQNENTAEEEDYRRDQIKEWLTQNTDFNVEELERSASQTQETAQYVTNQDEVLALAKVDWNRAQPLLRRMIADSTKPVSQTLARWAMYQHAVSTDDDIEADRLRKELQATVENKNAKPGDRDLAMDALVRVGNFPGRDDWYLSLLEDETLFDLRVNGQSYTGLTTLLNHSPPGKYRDKMLALLKSSNPAVRNAAVRNLATMIGDGDAEIIQALLPWLEDAKWAKEVQGQRRSLVYALAQLEMPESVPGLLAALDENYETNSNRSPYAGNRAIDTAQDVANVAAEAAMEAARAAASAAVNAASAAANSPAYNARAYTGPQKFYPLRAEAIMALAKQKDARAVAPLKRILPDVNLYMRRSVVVALIACNGFSPAEQVHGLEAYAKNQKGLRQRFKDSLLEMPTDKLGVPLSNTGSIAEKFVIDRLPDLKSETNARGGFAIRSAVNAAANMGGSPYDEDVFDTAKVPLMLGETLSSETQVSDDLVAAVSERIAALEKTDPELADELRRIIQVWTGPAVFSQFLRDLKRGKADFSAVVALLTVRKELREKQAGEIYDARGENAIAEGITACLLEDQNGYDAIISGDNATAKAALFACGRLIRARLPVAAVAANLDSADKRLAVATALYLESEDSPEARRILLALSPNRATIFGARNYFSATGGDTFGNVYWELYATVNDYFTSDEAGGLANGEELDRVAAKLQKEVLADQSLLGIYAYDDNFIRVYKDKAVFSWQQDPARYRERTLRAEEFNAFKEHLSRSRVDELPPFLSACDYCEGKELLMLGRAGGRRIFVRTKKKPEFFAGLEERFAEMRRPPAKLHYWLERVLPGLEILFEDENRQARAFWNNGADARLLLEDESRRKLIEKELRAAAKTDETSGLSYEQINRLRSDRYERREYEEFGWFSYSGNKLGASAAQPAQAEYIPPRDGLSVKPDPGQWRARAAGFEIRADSEGLYRVVNDRVTRIRAGHYAEPFISASGRWVVALRYNEDEGHRPARINLLTGREYPVRVDTEYPKIVVAGYSAAANRFVIKAGFYYEHDEDGEEDYEDLFLLDPETGAVKKSGAELRPLIQQTYRPLQPTGKPNEFWAALYDEKKDLTEFGVYDAKLFKFKPLLKLPDIWLDSMDIWVDQPEGKAYFTYEGHLLRFPLPAAVAALAGS
jgi:hypothetical protein